MAKKKLLTGLSVLVFLLVKFLGAYILYFYALIVLAALIFFSIKTVFFHSQFARDARRFNKPGFEERFLEPLYFAFNNETEFDSSLNGAFDTFKLSVWRSDLKTRRIHMLIFIGVTWALETIILSSSVLYELIGPASAKLSLYLSGSYSNKLETAAPVSTVDEEGKQKSEVELLIERIQKIQSELPAHTENENERAFTEAAEEYYREQNPLHRRNLRPRDRFF